MSYVINCICVWLAYSFVIIVYTHISYFFFFFQAEDGIRDHCVTGVQTCALPISMLPGQNRRTCVEDARKQTATSADFFRVEHSRGRSLGKKPLRGTGNQESQNQQIGRASCRERV